MSSKKFTLSTSAQTGSPLFNKIPPELRNRIYDLVLCEDERVQITQNIPEPALLATCQQIRKEAIGIYYTLNKLVIVVNSYDPSPILLFLRKNSHLGDYGMYITDVEMTLNGTGNWKNLKRWAQKVHEGEEASSNMDIAKCQSPGTNMLVAVLQAAKLSRASPWSEVETMLESMRFELIAINPVWASN